MIRRAQRMDPLASDPTPDQIRQRSEAIRKAWSPRERARRLGFKPSGWTPPTFRDADLPGYLANEFESR